MSVISVAHYIFDGICTTKDFVAFVGENDGYSVDEGTELELMNSLAQYTSFCIFNVHPIASESHVNEMIKGLAG